MTVIVPRNINCNKGLIATQAKPVCIILHSIKEITSDERKTLTKISMCNLSRQFPPNQCTFHARQNKELEKPKERTVHNWWRIRALGFHQKRQERSKINTKI